MSYSDFKNPTIFTDMKKVLVIEDNIVLRENTAEMLEVSGYKVQTAENGMEGFNKVLKYQPDVVICDMMMPKVDGVGFLKLMKKDSATNKIPIVFFSAGTPGSQVRDHLTEHGDAYLKKPFTNEELLAAVGQFANFD